MGEVCRFEHTTMRPHQLGIPRGCPCLPLPLPTSGRGGSAHVLLCPSRGYLEPSWPYGSRVATAYNDRILNDHASIEHQIDTLSPLSMPTSRLSASRPFSVPATILSEPKQPSPTRAEWKTVVMSPKPWPPESPPASFPPSRSPTPTAAPGKASEGPSGGTEGSLSASLVTDAS